MLFYTFVFSIVIPPWKDPRIHNFGNHGVSGFVHALVAQPATKIIDLLAYNNINVRNILHTEDSVDLGCGVGLSTSPGQIGVDSSKEMLQIAKYLHPSCKFYRGLAEKWGSENMTKCVSISFMLHEQDRNRRIKILKNAYRICKNYILIMDIHPSYKPSELMKTGEPYISNYLNNIESEILYLFEKVNKTELISDRVIMWNITKSSHA